MMSNSSVQANAWHWSMKEVVRFSCEQFPGEPEPQEGRKVRQTRVECVRRSEPVPDKMQNAEQSGTKNRDKSGRGSAKKSSLVNQSNSKQQQPQPTSSSNGSSGSGSVGNSGASVGVSNRSGISGSGIGGNGVSVGSAGTAAAKGNNPKQQQQQHQNNSCRAPPEVGVTTGSATNSNNSRGEVANNAMSTITAATGSNNSAPSGTTSSGGGGGGGAGRHQSSSQHSSPEHKSDTETTFSEFQPRVSDSSESDEESVSERIVLVYLTSVSDVHQGGEDTGTRKISDDYTV
ncbi:AAEL004632-PA [Aedes aegypti]|uniref:AAEL004632-PA n=1 Tax=Aedes aegypti TaxID=7159 RepID=Q17C94_AEDAE|nr:AAEL004632-PA [Aedes aegypti]